MQEVFLLHLKKHEHIKRLIGKVCTLNQILKAVQRVGDSFFKLFILGKRTS